MTHDERLVQSRELQKWSWTDSEEILSDDDLILLSMPLDAISSRRRDRPTFGPSVEAPVSRRRFSGLAEVA